MVVPEDFHSFNRFLARYLRNKVLFVALNFENSKNVLVGVLMFRRGILQKRVWHGSMIGLSAFGVLTSGLFGGQTIISSTFPGVGGEDPRFAQTFEPSTDDPVLNSLYDTHTNISKKPRSEVIEYLVKTGDTLSSIADEHDISVDTILWANDLTSKDSIKPGQKVKILPVSGVAHTVKSGDTLESVAKKYAAESQAVLDYPFNDLPDDFKLKTNQLLIVPDGVPPKAPISKPRAAPRYLAQTQGPAFSAPGGGSFSWPTRGSFTQYFSWYHPGIDLADSSAPPIAAADGGSVVVAGWPDNYGYGNRVVVDHGNGYKTLYAHLSNIYVSIGQTVSRGQVLGKMGTTGRSTGIHLHFEIRYKGIAVNPLAILK
ncbi:MAG: Peptidase M23 family protein [Candidatus Daviesbacteria bacterium GW2011_GWA1_41_61]|nr:MAG: lipoprotein precursor [Candidatus Daviesbacteria bacterium GW2011_GWC1_40_9]KKR92393.1 MAG: Peptidase M23 family protein [Candidatus Daviesbacteria bacterium GW2011_GWB1_41_15]KKS14581.1 MAG: Peptidase M23 family protein [Candidatus Daviesbacteria bacterium GW2011_GWA1_41_61]